MDPAPAPLLFEVVGSVAIVTLNRPESLNAIDGAMRAGLRDAWRRVQTDDAIKVAVLTAAGKRAFCAGADVRKQASRHRERDPRNEPVGPTGISPRQAGVTKPVICAVNGLCAGGGLQFVSDADVVIASERASFSNPGVSLGLIAPYGPIGLLRRGPAEPVFRMTLVGRAERVSARRAWEIGWVSAIAPVGELREMALTLAHAIAEQPADDLALAKQDVWSGLDRWTPEWRDGAVFRSR